MLKDLDQKMDELNVDAFIIYKQDLKFNENYYYLTKVKSPGEAFYIKAKNEDPFIFTTIPFEKATIEKESIVKNVVTYDDFFDKVKEYKDKNKKNLVILGEILNSLNVGKKPDIKWYGKECPLNTVDSLRGMKYRIKSVGGKEINPLDELRGTKDKLEIKYLKETARLSEKVLADTIEYIRNSKVENRKLLNSKTGEPLKVRDVKSFMYTRCSEENLINNRGEIIVTQGEEGAEPHNLGSLNRILKINKPTVIDFWPMSLENYYWYDISLWIYK